MEHLPIMCALILGGVIGTAISLQSIKKSIDELNKKLK